MHLSLRRTLVRRASHLALALALTLALALALALTLAPRYPSTSVP